MALTGLMIKAAELLTSYAQQQFPPSVLNRVC